MRKAEFEKLMANLPDPTNASLRGMVGRLMKEADRLLDGDLKGSRDAEKVQALVESVAMVLKEIPPRKSDLKWMAATNLRLGLHLAKWVGKRGWKKKPHPCMGNPSDPACGYAESVMYLSPFRCLGPTVKMSSLSDELKIMANATVKVLLDHGMTIERIESELRLPVRDLGWSVGRPN